MKKPHLALAITVLLSLSSCSSVRHSTPLAYAGDGRTAVASLESAIQKRGYKPICKSGEFCKFAYGEQVWVHYKTSAKKVVLVVDVADGKKLPADRVQALTDEATKVGESIWAEASSDAQAREKARAEEKAATAAAEARAEAEAEKAASSRPSNGSAGEVLSGILSAAGSLSVSTGSGAPAAGAAPASGNATCCINRALYECPSVAATNKCAGETSACLMKCMNSSDSGCGDRCMRDHPPDPSGCSRRSDRDGECR